MYLKAVRKWNLLRLCTRGLTTTGTPLSVEETSKKEAVKRLYAESFALTQGRPSEDLLCALRQHAELQGVMVTGEEIGELEFAERAYVEKTKQAKVRVIKSNSYFGGDMVNMYIDLYLRSGHLKKAHDVISLNRNIPLEALKPAILWRYGLACQKARQVPKVPLPVEVVKMVEIVSLHEKSSLTKNTNYSALEMLVQDIDQQFVTDFLNQYNLLHAEFELIKAALHSVKPELMFNTSLEKYSEEELYTRYPVIRGLEEAPSLVHPYTYTSYTKDSVITQLKNELHEFTDVRSIGKNHSLHIKNLGRYKRELRNQWSQALHDGLRHELYLYRRGDTRNFRLHYAPFLETNVRDLSGLSKAVISYFCEDMMNYEGMQVGFSARSIGNLIHKRYSQQFVTESTEHYYKYISQLSQSPGTTPQQVWEKLYPPQYHAFMPLWPTTACTELGGHILSIARETITFNSEELKMAFKNHEFSGKCSAGADAVFTHGYKIPQMDQKKSGSKDNWSVGVFEIDPEIHRLMLTNMQTRGYFKFDTTETPMSCPPRPWRNITGTPMLKTAVPFVRHAGVEWKQYFEGMLSQYDNNGSLDIVKTSLDTLGLLPWTINPAILDVQTRLFNKGGSEPLSIAVEFTKRFVTLSDTASAAEAAEYNLNKKLLLKEKRERYALRCTQLYTLSLANHFLHKPFWQCYNIDFRGRVYAVAPHLNHLMGDPARGLLLFDEGKPLGPEGLRWLKIHCVNKFGDIKKATFDEKEAYADQHLSQIVDSAVQMCPDNGWWAQAKDDPWQCLATCIEIHQAIESGDPESYVCRLPVHMDGSCNGLQHYAALGRDVEGAKKVNVYPSDKPEDVYMAVLNIVQRLVEADYERGHEAAKLVHGLVERKTIKQTVMTQVYGVTEYGAHNQIKGKLVDQGVPEKEALMGAVYLSKLAFKAVDELFTQAQLIQDWLNSTAYDIAKSGEPVSWVTPLGLPCVQPYMKEREYRAGTMVQTITYVVPAPDKPVNARKQKTAFPPNFVHSQDSTHMMMTSIKCYQHGIPFAAVHDSFWTLPCHVTQMNEILREQFVAIYDYQVLKGLRDSFVEHFPSVTIAELPTQGALDIEQVKKSQYFFS